MIKELSGYFFLILRYFSSLIINNYVNSIFEKINHQNNKMVVCATKSATIF